MHIEQKAPTMETFQSALAALLSWAKKKKKRQKKGKKWGFFFFFFAPAKIPHFGGIKGGF